LGQEGVDWKQGKNGLDNRVIYTVNTNNRQQGQSILNNAESMKQLKSRAQDLRILFERNITVADIAEKLKYCNGADDALVIRQHMKDLDFDVFGIEEKGIICGYLEQASLESGPCIQYQHEFHASDLIAESTPLIDLLPILRDGSQVFVLDRNRVSGIVTRGDYKKHQSECCFLAW